MANNTVRHINIIGHQNPDTDSICSALAYAWLKNRGRLTGLYEARRAGLPLIFYMFTDMKTQSTDLMFYGHNAEEIIRDAFHVEPEGNIAKLPGVVSRKKQLIPPLLAALQARQ